MKNARERRIVFSNVKENKKKAEQKSVSKSNELFDYNKEIVIGLKVPPQPKIKKDKNSKKQTEELDIPFQKEKKTKLQKKVKSKKDKTPSQKNKTRLTDKTKPVAKAKPVNKINSTTKANPVTKIKQKTKVKPVVRETKAIVKSKPKKKITSENKKLILNITKWTTLGIVIIGGLIYLLLSPVFNIKNIKVTGNNLISTQTITSLSGINLDENLFKIRKTQIIKNIKQNAYIEDVKINRKIYDTVEIIVQERKPTFIIQLGEGYVYLNNQGYILEISSEKLNLPNILGQQTANSDMVAGNRLNNEDLKRLEMVLKIKDVAQSNEIGEFLTGIDISDDNDYKMIFEGEQKIAYLGDCTNISTRMLYVKAILKQETGRAGEIFVNIDLNKENPFFREKV